MPKYKVYFRKMLEENKPLFSRFTEIHAAYELEPEMNQKAFNEIGEKIQEIIREYESRLCSHSQKGEYSKFSPNLAEKFREEIKKVFPKIDFIGVSTTKGFILKKLQFFN
jgi:sugar-specific transcriptional regulator TrmB